MFVDVLQPPVELDRIALLNAVRQRLEGQDSSHDYACAGAISAAATANAAAASADSGNRNFTERGPEGALGRC